MTRGDHGLQIPTLTQRQPLGRRQGSQARPNQRRSSPRALSSERTENRAFQSPPFRQPPHGAILNSHEIVSPVHSCRSCTSFASWATQTKATLKAEKQPLPPPDCPPDVEQLGRSSWTLLHSIAATYPEAPSTSQKSDLLGFVRLFAKLYPCWTCAEDFQAYMARRTPTVGSRGEFGLWLCDAHNDVNKKLGKPVFDCSLWEERWRTGWKDGRCD